MEDGIRLRRYTHGMLKDNRMFQILDIHYIDVDDTGKILDARVAVLIDAAYKVVSLKELIKDINFTTVSGQK